MAYYTHELPYRALFVGGAARRGAWGGRPPRGLWGGRPHRLGPSPPPPWGPGGEGRGEGRGEGGEGGEGGIDWGGDTPRYDTKPLKIIQSPNRLHKAPKILCKDHEVLDKDLTY